jgi:hypothetical protein
MLTRRRERSCCLWYLLYEQIQSLSTDVETKVLNTQRKKKMSTDKGRTKVLNVLIAGPTARRIVDRITSWSFLSSDHSKIQNSHLHNSKKKFWSSSKHYYCEWLWCNSSLSDNPLFKDAESLPCTLWTAIWLKNCTKAIDLFGTQQNNCKVQSEISLSTTYRSCAIRLSIAVISSYKIGCRSLNLYKNYSFSMMPHRTIVDGFRAILPSLFSGNHIVHFKAAVVQPATTGWVPIPLFLP